MKYRIGEYFELSQGRETPHEESVIDAEDSDDAFDVAKATYGWGAWATREDEYQKNLALSSGNLSELK
jgi:hypothetical protein